MLLIQNTTTEAVVPIEQISSTLINTNNKHRSENDLFSKYFVPEFSNIFPVLIF